MDYYFRNIIFRLLRSGGVYNKQDMNHVHRSQKVQSCGRSPLRRRFCTTSLIYFRLSDFPNVCCIVTDYSYVNVYELVNLWTNERTDGRTSVMRSTNRFVFLVIFHVLLLLFVFVLSVVIVLVFVALVVVVVVVLTKHMFVNYRLRHRKERFCFVHEVLLGEFQLLLLFLLHLHTHIHTYVCNCVDSMLRSWPEMWRHNLAIAVVLPLVSSTRM